MDFVDIENNDGEMKPPLISGDLREVNAHIRNVYAHLCGLLVMATLGCAFQIRLGMQLMLPVFLLALGCLVYVMVGSNTTARVVCFLSFGLLDGWLAGGLISALHSPPGVVLSALVLTGVIFGCFTMSATLAKRRSYLYMGGILSSCITGLLVVGLLQLFFQWKLLYAISLYGGLVVFSLYVAYDTQVMIERAHNGNRDPLRDAIDLFIDFMAIFRRVLIILSERE